MPAVLSDELTFKHRIGIVQTPGKVVRVIDESLNTGEDIVDKLVVGPIFDIANWRIYADDGSVDAATPLAAENTAIKVGPGKDVEFGDNFLIRFQLNELNIANPPLANYRLRKQVNGASSDLYNISANEKFNLGSSLNLTDGAAVTSSLLTSPGGTFETGEVIEDVNSPPRFFNHDFLKNGFTELVVVGTVLDSASGGSAVDGDLFRVGIQLEDGTEIFTSLIATVNEGIVHPNEPAGYTVIASTPFDCIPSGTTCMDAGAAQDHSTANNSIVNDGGNVLRTTYPAGLGAGSAPCNIDFWDGTSGGGAAEYKELYISQRMRLVSGAGDGLWEFYSGVNKMGFLGYQGSVPSDLIIRGMPSNTGAGTGVLEDRVNLQVTQQNNVSRVIGTNEHMIVGVWYNWELQFILNNPANNQGSGTSLTGDGILRWWIDGVLIKEVLDMAYLSGTSGHAGFFTYRWNPTWGGGTNHDNKARTDHQHMDDLYISGVPK